MYEKEILPENPNAVDLAQNSEETACAFQAETESTLGERNGETEEKMPGTDLADGLENLTDSDSTPTASDSLVEADREDLAELRQEVTRLRALLVENEARAQRMRDECAELAELYPSLSPNDLPDEVWDAVRKGVPIAAAVALSERKKFLLSKKAEAANLANRSRSSGAVERAKNGFYSIDEVRAMSASEVRENYQNILKSMQKWR